MRAIGVIVLFGSLVAMVLCVTAVHAANFSAVTPPAPAPSIITPPQPIVINTTNQTNSTGSTNATNSSNGSSSGGKSSGTKSGGSSSTSGGSGVIVRPRANSTNQSNSTAGSGAGDTGSQTKPGTKTATSSSVEQASIGSTGASPPPTWIPEDDDSAGPDLESPAPTGSGFPYWLLLILLIPLAVGSGAWYVIAHKKQSATDTSATPLDAGGSFEQTLLMPSSETMGVSGMGAGVGMGSAQTAGMLSQPVSANRWHVALDPATLRKARQAVAGLRAQNIPDHRIARMLKEAEWPAAYVDEAMRRDQN